MTTDITALRQQLTAAGLTHGPLHEALDELERTRAERDELRAAVDRVETEKCEAIDWAKHQHRAADRYAAQLDSTLKDRTMIFVERDRTFALMLARAETAEAELAAAQQREARRTFPILKGDGAKIDYQLVADHAEQARSNHGQSVDRLAARGGLSWCELYAVLHNRKWEKVDKNEAMIACRSLEARYLAALSNNGRTGDLPDAVDPPCTDCDDTGITHQTERFCSCGAGIAAAHNGRGE